MNNRIRAPHMYLWRSGAVRRACTVSNQNKRCSIIQIWCRFGGLGAACKGKPAEGIFLIICFLSLRWWAPQTSKWDCDRPRRAAQSPTPPVSPHAPSQTVSLWLSSRHWTLTRGPEPHSSPMLTRNCLLLFLWILVDEGSVSSLRPPSPALGRSRTGREHARSLVGPMRNGAAGFQRVKRGWVWNQFFVLEEYMGSDPQYVGKVKSLFLQLFMVQQKS